MKAKLLFISAFVLGSMASSLSSIHAYASEIEVNSLAQDTITLFQEYSDSFEALKTNYAKPGEKNTSAGYVAYLKEIQDSKDTFEISKSMSAIEKGYYQVEDASSISKDIENKATSTYDNNKAQALGALVHQRQEAFLKAKENTETQLSKNDEKSVFGEKYKEAVDKSNKELAEKEKETEVIKKNETDKLAILSNSYVAIKEKIKQDSSYINEKAVEYSKIRYSNNTNYYKGLFSSDAGKYQSEYESNSKSFSNLAEMQYNRMKGIIDDNSGKMDVVTDGEYSAYGIIGQQLDTNKEYYCKRAVDKKTCGENRYVA